MRALTLLLAIGCASAGASSFGSVSFKSMSNLSAPPVALSVGKNHVVGGALDVREDDGCIRGAYENIPLSFCRDDKGDGPQQHWSGASGEFTVAPAADHLSVRGEMILDTRRVVSMNQDLPYGSGSQWDELRRHPGLMAVAATAADLHAVGIRR